MLRTAFTNERFAPELLPNKDDLVKRIRQMVEEQVRRHEEVHIHCCGLQSHRSPPALLHGRRRASASSARRRHSRG